MKNRFSKLIKKGDWVESLYFLGAPSLGNRRTLGRLRRRLRAAVVLKLATTPFPMSWLCDKRRSLESFGFIQARAFICQG